MLFNRCNDENLLLMARSQNPDAFYALTKRYFDMRHTLYQQASAPLAKMFDAWDLNHAFFTAFNSSIRSFELGQGSFHAYMVKALRNAMIRDAEKLHLFKGPKTISLDEENEHGTLHDVVPAKGEDPRMYVNYLEEARAYGKAKGTLSEEVLQVARLRLDGCKFKEIAEILSISPRRASRDFKLYEEAVSKIVIKEK